MLACFGWIWLACQAHETRMLDERATVMTLEVVRSPGSPASRLIRVRNGGDAPVLSSPPSCALKVFEARPSRRGG